MTDSNPMRTQIVENLRVQTAEALEKHAVAILSTGMGMFLALSGLLKLISGLILQDVSWWSLLVYAVVSVILIGTGRSEYKEYKKKKIVIDGLYERLK